MVYSCKKIRVQFVSYSWQFFDKQSDKVERV